MSDSDEPIRDEPPRQAALPEAPAGNAPAENAPAERAPREKGTLEPPENPEIRYEVKDVRFRGVLIGTVAGACVGAVIIALVYAFFRADTNRLAVRRESDFPLAEHPSETPPPEPRLEQIDRVAGNPRENVFLREKAKENRLAGYGPTEDERFVHVPIDRAIQSLAGHLPVRKETAPGPGKDNGLVDSGASNSGRMFRSARPQRIQGAPQ